jgi:hypothetical protein
VRARTLFLKEGALRLFALWGLACLATGAFAETQGQKIATFRTSGSGGFDFEIGEVQSVRIVDAMGSKKKMLLIRFYPETAQRYAQMTIDNVGMFIDFDLCGRTISSNVKIQTPIIGESIAGIVSISDGDWAVAVLSGHQQCQNPGS